MIGNDWDLLLKDEYNKDYFKKLQKFVIEEYKTKTVYPKMSEIFNAFYLIFMIKNISIQYFFATVITRKAKIKKETIL